MGGALCGDSRTDARLSYCLVGARVGLPQAAAGWWGKWLCAWYGDDSPHLARRPAVRGDGALGEQARPVNLLARAACEPG